MHNYSLDAGTKSMRTAEWINLFFFSLLTVLGWLYRVPQHDRGMATRLGLAGIALSVLPHFIDRYRFSLALPTLRDWLPAALMPLAYWQTGAFFPERHLKLEHKLQQFDQKLFSLWNRSRADGKRHWLVNACLELAYSLCYVLIPGGLAVLYLSGQTSQADWYWAVVLPPTYLCYLVTVFVHVLPPRFLEDGQERGAGVIALRRFNLWMLENTSIKFATFPSAHVASTMAASLALLWLAPAGGAIFLPLSVGIALGAATGRYHYFVDVLLGALLAIAAFIAQVVGRLQ